jgi:hypothetical protein
MQVFVLLNILTISKHSKWLLRKAKKLMRNKWQLLTEFLLKGMG